MVRVFPSPKSQVYDEPPVEMNSTPSQVVYAFPFTGGTSHICPATKPPLEMVRLKILDELRPQLLVTVNVGEYCPVSA